MININGCKWQELELSDVKEFLSNLEERNESIFFENKSDNVRNGDIAKEVAAFANTLGGYIFIGVDDDFHLSGCQNWDEERVHNVIRDSISPTPVIDIKQLSDGEKSIVIVKIEEGDCPPYMTNQGRIYERISSGSYPIKDSKKLDMLCEKSKNNIARIAREIEIPQISVGKNTPSNLCGSIDVGFSMTTIEPLALENNYLDINIEPVVEILEKGQNPFTISRLGKSYVITLGSMSGKQNGLYDAGEHNFMQILPNGSCSYRIILHSEEQSEMTNIASILIASELFSDIYSVIVDNDLPEKFVRAYKYQRLDVIKQFTPFYKKGIIPGLDETFNKRYMRQCEKYGGVRVVTGNRIPNSDFEIIDKEIIQTRTEGRISKTGILKCLFATSYMDLGYIAPIEYVSVDDSQG